ncbi:DNA polymerase III subunit gamma and tau [Nonomuraea sp. NEAU-A123]|uniref:DNA polymerase III subunit gamma and tau n=1 Tax=Nonomuraea sp. NEAU-A123 TaxID=2839649 RepID=UPI001BE4B70E|nr:DNA polymerase III subunit gamma and tau [Nonomuraea sp. NEAU-A123]
MSLALYRRYRPGTFAEVKGQEHVTDPLRQALRTGRINHAYLFSGPRGCGKTSSARILARSLNCEKGPTPDPCGVCESCVALAPTGPGHLDVIEIDAASHGGVDDARDLRERAFFAPVSARYKIYIIDEAHMVTREGFNALLKLVEEPPPHLKFIFATTEPEKVIGTIKSRTHHYPFRLMPPATLRALLEEILLAENVPFEPTALPLVVRAGAGSARDSLSILDQLLAGAEEDGITYAKAVSLLGYTDGDLLDEVVHAFATRDGAQVFHTVNRVIEGGHDPRRFAADLLERFRDLVILANVPEAATSGLLDRPADELDRLVQQAGSMGPAELTRAAEIFNTGLTEMRGATSPRLLLELMCARVLLPGASQGEDALLARLERLERGGAVAQMAARAVGTARDSGPPVAPMPQPGAASAQGGASHVAGGSYAAGAAQAGGAGHSGSAGYASGGPQAGSAAYAGGAATPGSAAHAGGPQVGAGVHADGSAADGSADGASTSAGSQAGGADDWPEPARPGRPAQSAAGSQGAASHGVESQALSSHAASSQGQSSQGQSSPGQSSHGQGSHGQGSYGQGAQAQGSSAQAGAAHGGGGVAAGGAGAVQQQWPAVLAALKQRSIVVWANVSTNAQVVGIEGNLVTLGFGQVGAMKNFTGGGKDAVVASALGDVFGGTWRVEAVVGGSPVPQGSGGPRPGSHPGPQPGSHSGPQSGPQPGSHSGPQSGPQPGSHSGPQPGSHAGQQDPSSASRYNQAGSGAAPQSTAQGGQPSSGHGRTRSHGSSDDDSGSQEASQPPGPADHAAQGGGRPTTDESWPDAPDDPSPGSPPTPDPTQSTSGVRPQGRPGSGAPGGTPPAGGAGSGLAAARSAAKAAAQAGPRAPAPRQGGSTAWPDAVPERRKGPEADEVDPLNDADADVNELSGMALLQSQLGAQVIGEIDHN